MFRVRSNPSSSSLRPQFGSFFISSNFKKEIFFFWIHNKLFKNCLFNIKLLLKINIVNNPSPLAPPHITNPSLPTQTHRFRLVKSYFCSLYPFSNLNVLKLSLIFISFTYCKKSVGNGAGPTQTLL